jgi:hypothetical protein
VVENTGVRFWPNSEAQVADFSVCFGESGPSEMENKRRLPTYSVEKLFLLAVKKNS